MVVDEDEDSVAEDGRERFGLLCPVPYRFISLDAILTEIDEGADVHEDKNDDSGIG